MKGFFEYLFVGSAVLGAAFFIGRRVYWLWLSKKPSACEDTPSGLPGPCPSGCKGCGRG